jgi:hypothetical protein
VTAFPCGGEVPTASNANFVAGQDVANLVTVVVGATGEVCLSPSVDTHLLVDIAGWFGTGGDRFNPVSPARWFDSRLRLSGSSNGPVSGLAVQPGEIVRLEANLGIDSAPTGIPAFAPTSMMVNVTSTGASGSGYVTVFPCGSTPPVVSNLNFTANSSIANLAVVTTGTSPGARSVCLTTSAATHLIVDIAGWYGVSGVTFHPVPPDRILDTRAGRGAPLGLVEAFTPLAIQVRGRGGVPATGSGAVTVNVTVAGPVNAGYVTVYPCGGSAPNASNVNFPSSADVPNLVTVPIAADGTICLISSARTHLIADVAGWYDAA